MLSWVLFLLIVFVDPSPKNEPFILFSSSLVNNTDDDGYHQNKICSLTTWRDLSFQTSVMVSMDENC